MASKDSARPVDSSASEQELAQVLAGCRQGERPAQRRLYELCHDKVYRLMVRMVGIQDAADLTQQVFLHVFRKIDQFAGKARFETWLYRVASNEALQHLRRSSRRTTLPLQQEPMSHHPREDKQHEAKELLEQAIAQLDPELRSIFLMREIDKLSYDEIAVAADIPAGTVGSRLNRARRELRQCLIDLGWEP